VKQQQLQLALEQVCVTVELSPQDTRSGLLLLVLLLLRAEPPLRLAFLQGPWGGLLLAALQLYACGRTPLHEALEAAVPGLAADQSCGLVVSQQIGGEGLVEGFRPHSVSTFLSTEGSAAWLLNWLLLQPQGSCDVTSTSESSSSSVSACSRSINATSSSKGRSSPSRSTCVSPHNSSGSSSRPLGCGPLDPDTSWRATPVVQCGLAGCKAGERSATPPICTRNIPFINDSKDVCSTIGLCLLVGCTQNTTSEYVRNSYHLTGAQHVLLRPAVALHDTSHRHLHCCAPVRE
jgi:hypothetical protein